MLTKAIREKRLQRSGSLLSRATPSVVDRILFSDQKLFTIEEVSQAVYKISRSNFDSYQDVKSQLQSWYVAESPKCPSILISVPFGVKTNSKTYRELILDTKVKGFGRKKFGIMSWTFQ